MSDQSQSCSCPAPGERYDFCPLHPPPAIPPKPHLVKRAGFWYCVPMRSALHHGRSGYSSITVAFRMGPFAALPPGWDHPL